MNQPKVSFRLPADELQEIDNLVKDGEYPARSDFFRTAVLSELHYQRNRKLTRERLP